MKRSKISALLVTAAVLVGSSPAFAAGPPYTVSVGGSSAQGTHAFTATSTGSVILTWKNNAGTLLKFNCTSISMSGSISSGPNKNPWASIGSSVWTGCRIPGGAATVTQLGPWPVAGDGSNATSGNESVDGAIDNVAATFQSTPSSVCSFTFHGQANTTFDESTQRLVIHETGFTGNLTISGVSGCFGQWQNGNKMDLEATLAVTSPDGAINLS